MILELCKVSGPSQFYIREIAKWRAEEYIRNRYPCIGDCESCGLCKVFRGKNAETAYADYIKGERSFLEVSGDFR